MRPSDNADSPDLSGEAVLDAFNKSIGLNWYDELTQTVTPWSQWAKVENQPIYFAYWTDRSGTHLREKPGLATLAQLIEKRIVYLVEIHGMNLESAQIQIRSEINNLNINIPLKTCELCRRLYNPYVTFFRSQSTCSEECHKNRLWQESVKKGMSPEAEFDRSITWQAVWERFGPFCYICGIETVHDQPDLKLRQGTRAWKARWGTYKRGDVDRQAVVEHVHPRSRGGSHTWDNVRIACSRCNLLKGDRARPPSI